MTATFTRQRLFDLANFKPSGSNSVNSATREEWKTLAQMALDASIEKEIRNLHHLYYDVGIISASSYVERVAELYSETGRPKEQTFAPGESVVIDNPYEKLLAGREWPEYRGCFEGVVDFPHSWTDADGLEVMGAAEVRNAFRTAFLLLFSQAIVKQPSSDAELFGKAEQVEPVSDANKLPGLVEGMEVSVDVSSCDADAGHRYFGTVTEVSELEGAKNGFILLVQNAEPNFKPVGNSLVIPDGYALVPIVPTEDMVINGFESVPDPHFSDEKEWKEYEAMSGCRQAARRAELCWAAMIKAAPDEARQPLLPGESAVIHLEGKPILPIPIESINDAHLANEHIKSAGFIEGKAEGTDRYFFKAHYGQSIDIGDKLYASRTAPDITEMSTSKPLLITLPDVTSKAFWSGTGRNQTFYPEAYKRWVKEAIERGCAMAKIEVKVK